MVSAHLDDSKQDTELTSVSLEDNRKEVRIAVVPTEAQVEVVAKEVEEPDSPETVEVVEEQENRPPVRKAERKKVPVETPTVEQTDDAVDTLTQLSTTKLTSKVYTVPFFSQFTDITPVNWKKVGCGIASLSMLVDFYVPGAASVDELLQQGIAAGAYLTNAGWTHAGLINLSRQFGLGGESRSLASLSMTDAFNELTKVVNEGPVMVSVHYTFEPTNPIPHLVVVSGVRDGKVFYNDPAEVSGGGSLPIEKFKSAWKKRYISIRPV